MKKHPEYWYIITTEQNFNILNSWRLSKASQHVGDNYVTTKLEIGYPVLSQHTCDNSYFYNESYYYFKHNPKYAKYQEIDLQTFLQITNMKTYTVTREQFQQGYELACGKWKIELMELVGKNLVLSDTTEVSQELINVLYSEASNTEQRNFLDKLFLDPFKIRAEDLAIGEAMRVEDGNGSYSGVILLRTFDGYVDINSPRSTWSNKPPFKGTKVKLEIKVIE